MLIVKVGNQLRNSDEIFRCHNYGKDVPFIIVKALRPKIIGLAMKMKRVVKLNDTTMLLNIFEETF